MISPETIALVRDRTDIVAVISESVPSLKRRGRSFVGLCPFHKEKSPSFHVNPDRGFFHCFGCKEAGSVIDFVMKEQGYTFPEAIRALAERAGIPIEEDARPRTEVDRVKKQKDDLYAANQLAATYFEEQLREHPLRQFALDELARRGIVPGKDPAVDEALQAFRIGYAPAEWDGLTGFFRRQGISPVAGESVGLLVPRSGGSGHYDRFRHRLMFAVVDPQGRVVAFSGRALADPPATAGQPARDEKPAKYINSPESPIYSKGQALFGLYQARHAIRQQEVAVVVEGNFDVFSLHARGFTHVVAPLGTAFTVDQARLLKRYASEVVLLFDGDLAGRKAVRLSREPCMQAGLSVKVASLPEGTDPDDLARGQRGQDGMGALKDVVAQSKGMLEFMIESALDETFAQADAYERLGRIEQIAKLLAAEDDPFIKLQAKAYADRVAGRLDIRDAESFRALEAKVKEAVRRAGPRPEPRRSPVPGSRPERNEESDSPNIRRTDSAPPGPGYYGSHGSHGSHDSHDSHADSHDAYYAAPQMADPMDRDRANDSPKTARIPQKTAGSAERREIVGALIEYPSLLSALEVQAEMDLLEGPAALAVSALRSALTEQKTLDTTRFLAQIPTAIQAFAHGRLAAPRHESEAAAKDHLLDNAHKLRRLFLSRETDGLARDVERAAGDSEAETSLLREALERARQKHNLR